jgi:site-specific DNA-cytosine methylase
VPDRALISDPRRAGSWPIPWEGRKQPDQGVPRLRLRGRSGAAGCPALPAANLGDIRTVNWAAIAEAAPVDVLTAGFPCQDYSE